MGLKSHNPMQKKQDTDILPKKIVRITHTDKDDEGSNTWYEDFSYNADGTIASIYNSDEEKTYTLEYSPYEIFITNSNIIGTKKFVLKDGRIIRKIFVECYYDIGVDYDELEYDEQTIRDIFGDDLGNKFLGYEELTYTYSGDLLSEIKSVNYDASFTNHYDGQNLTKIEFNCVEGGSIENEKTVTTFEYNGQPNNLNLNLLDLFNDEWHFYLDIAGNRNKHLPSHFKVEEEYDLGYILREASITYVTDANGYITEIKISGKEYRKYDYGYCHTETSPSGDIIYITPIDGEDVEHRNDLLHKISEETSSFEEIYTITYED